MTVFAQGASGLQYDEGHEEPPACCLGPAMLAGCYVKLSHEGVGHPAGFQESCRLILGPLAAEGCGSVQIAVFQVHPELALLALSAYLEVAHQAAAGCSRHVGARAMNKAAGG